MIPSTLMKSAPVEANVEEPSKLIVLLLTFALGLILGPVLGLLQYFILKAFSRRAVWWVEANALAWALGMLIIFAGIDLALRTTDFTLVGLLILTFGLCGLAVATIQGLFLFFTCQILSYISVRACLIFENQKLSTLKVLEVSYET
jgi:hypothetical protein